MHVTTILRVPDVCRASGAGRSALYGWIADGLWTQPVHLGTRMVGWPAGEVDQLIRARVAGLTDQEIRALVARLVDDRKAGAPTITAAEPDREEVGCHA